MDRQETYDKVRDHLMTQRTQSKRLRDGNGGFAGQCLYRGPVGRSCAVGCLIPDELYAKTLEGDTVDELPRDVLDAIGVETDDDIQFLLRLQDVHDNGDGKRFAAKLYDFAITNGLRP